jgi:uncharacterized protein YkwD
MMRTTAIAGAIAALIAGGTGAATASAKSSTDTGGCAGAYVIAKDAASTQRASDAVLCLVNRERTARGLGALKASTRLERAATSHSAEMVAGKFFSHSGSDGSGVVQRVSRAGYDWTAVGETLAWGAAQRAMPSRLVAALMRSGEHRPIMLGSGYRDLGVGLVLGAPVRGAGPRASTLTLDFASS